MIIGGVQTLVAHIEARLKTRPSCLVFRRDPDRVWPLSQREATNNSKRYAQILKFAKARGWSARIYDPGIRVTFRKLPTNVETAEKVRSSPRADRSKVGPEPATRKKRLRRSPAANSQARL
jgi:hypothetical protein